VVLLVTSRFGHWVIPLNPLGLLESSVGAAPPLAESGCPAARNAIADAGVGLETKNVEGAIDQQN
jgi:hypothetical protein